MKKTTLLALFLFAAVAQAEDKLAERQQQIDAHRDLSSSLALDDTETAA